MGRRLWWVMALAVLWGSGVGAAAETLHVDNLRGDDGNPGTREAPLASVERACELVKKSGRIEVANTGRPYSLLYDGPEKARGLTLRPGGTLEKPLVVEGNGAVISGFAVIPAEAWKDEGGRVWSLPFWPMANQYKNYDPEKTDFWLDGTRIWFVDGEHAPNLHSAAELAATPGGFWWNKRGRKVHFHLPEGKTLQDLRIELPANYGFYIHGDHTVVRNFVVVGSWNDGFDTAGIAQNAVYRDCVAIGNCGQGFSAHGATGVYYEDCVAIRCASSNVCNIDQSRAVYRRCVLAENTFEASVFLYGDADALFEECLIVDPSPFELAWQHERTSLAFVDSVLIGRDDHNLFRARFGTLALLNCTLLNARGLVDLEDKNLGASLSMARCALGGFSRYYMKLPEAFHKERFSLANNHYASAVGHRRGGKNIPIAELDRESRSAPLELGGRRGAEPKEAVTRRSQRRGALLPPSVWRNYEKWRHAEAAPDGVRFREAPAGE